MLITFEYDKKNREPCKRRFIITNSFDKNKNKNEWPHTIDGVDLEDYQFKSFLTNKIVDNVECLLEKVPYDAESFSLNDRKAIYNVLSFDDEVDPVLDLLNGDQLCSLVEDRVEINALYSYDKFILYLENNRTVDFILNETSYTMHINRDCLTFNNNKFDNDVQLSVNEFIEEVL